MHASAQKTTLTNTPNMGISASMDTCLTIDTSLSIDKLLTTDTCQSEHRGRSFCWFVLNSICKQGYSGRKCVILKSKEQLYVQLIKHAWGTTYTCPISRLRKRIHV